MRFASSGDVDGAFRINYAGSASGLVELSFTGKYVMSTGVTPAPGPQSNSPFHPPPPALPSPAGLISTQIPVYVNGALKGTSYFDYAFVLVSNDEMLITASARNPRAGVMSGTMKRIAVSV
jgi:hypothetical protein